MIPNPVDLDMFDPGKIPEEKKNAFREKFGYQHGETVGLFVGRLGREKSTFAGKVLHTDMPPYVGTCDFYITASTSDTDSISMLEGMAMGLPVLQIIDPLNEGQVRDGVNGYIFHDAQDMADKIRMLSGAVNLAEYVLKVYNTALHKKRRSRLMTTPAFRVHLRKQNKGD